MSQDLSEDEEVLEQEEEGEEEEGDDVLTRDSRNTRRVEYVILLHCGDHCIYIFPEECHF